MYKNDKTPDLIRNITETIHIIQSDNYKKDKIQYNDG